MRAKQWYFWGDKPTSAKEAIAVITAIRVRIDWLEPKKFTSTKNPAPPASPVPPGRAPRKINPNSMKAYRKMITLFSYR